MSPWVALALVALGLLLWVLLSTGCYLLLLEVRSWLDIRRRAWHDYRAARGTQHLRQIRAALSALQRDRRDRRGQVTELQRQSARTKGDHATAQSIMENIRDRLPDGLMKNMALSQFGGLLEK